MMYVLYKSNIRNEYYISKSKTKKEVVNLPHFVFAHRDFNTVVKTGIEILEKELAMLTKRTAENIDYLKNFEKP